MLLMQLTLVDGSQALINMDNVNLIRPHKLNNFRNVTSTMIFFNDSDEPTEVKESLKQITSLINKRSQGVNYHG